MASLSDDEFGEFGGFEAADEVQRAPENQQAAPSPWAAMAAAAATGLPQLPDLTAPSGGNGAAAAGDTPGHVTGPGHVIESGGVTNWAALGEEFSEIASSADATQPSVSWASLALSEQDQGNDELQASSAIAGVLPTASTGVLPTASTGVLPAGSAGMLPEVSDGVLPAVSASVLPAVSAGVLPAVSAHTHSGPGVLNDLEFDLDLDVNKPTQMLDSENKLQDIQTSNAGSHDHKSHDLGLLGTGSREEGVSGCAEGTDSKALQELELLKSQQQKIKSELQQELERLKRHNVSLERGSEAQKQELQDQRQRYNACQERHMEELAEVRAAGHQAIAIIVEEYKELCKVAILEEQDHSNRFLKDAIADHIHQQEALLNKQEEEFRARLNTLETEHERKVEKALTSAQEQHQRDLESALEQAKSDARQDLHKTMQEVENRHRKSLTDAMDEKRKKYRLLLDQQQVKYQEDSAEIKTDAAHQVARAVAEQSEKCQACIRDALDTEQAKHSNTMTTVMADAKVLMEGYVTEQRTADARSRQRSLATVDFFLEGARQQIHLLLSPDGATSDSDQR